jgi:hypothetical protein
MYWKSVSWILYLHEVVIIEKIGNFMHKLNFWLKRAKK